MPTQYVQLVATLRPTTENAIADAENGDPIDSHLKSELSCASTPMQPTSTDFENLIELNARKHTIDSIQPIKFDSKSIVNGTTNVVAPNAVISSTSSTSFSGITKNPNGSLKVKSNNVLQQMEVDEHSPLNPNQTILPAIKFPLNMENKLINKVKIVVDNMTSGSGVTKHRLDTSNNSYNLLQQSHNQQPSIIPHQVTFQNYNFHSNFHLYEYNQNNQNFLNQHRPDAGNNNQTDENMWRPW